MRAEPHRIPEFVEEAVRLEPPFRFHYRVVKGDTSLCGVPLLAAALSEASVEAPVTSGLARLIAGELPLHEWIALVRTTVPVPARRLRTIAFCRKTSTRIRRSK